MGLFSRARRGDEDRLILKNDEVCLKLDQFVPENREEGLSPAFFFDICSPDGKKKMGRCDLRIGHNERLYYGGNIGYNVKPRYRGNHYAAKACKLLFELAKQEGVPKWGGKIPPNLKLPLRDGDVDRPDDPAYENSYFINATSQEQPGIVDRKRVKITDPLAIYSGCYIRASINIYPFNANGNRGIAAGLSNIQFWEDGEPLNGRVRAEDEFDALDDEDTDDFLD